ncbi:RHS repeat domain-containing protein, partial [Tenacibaculum maritimum]|uniref:RHS repeat domain-containing protein n=1 Tax=Tenacibaculum maritimum TaxID=107401 RepID=UPI001916158F
YVYQYKDHLGNIRLSYTDNNNDGVIQTDGMNTEIIEESNYYPFGLKHKGYNGNISSLGNSVAQKFGYNGKELNEELGIQWMDFGARNYDAALGRWMNLDPLAEKMRRHSPYNYAFDNPVYFIDPDGMMPQGPGWPINGGGIARGITNFFRSIFGGTDGPKQKPKQKLDNNGYNFVSKDGTNTGQRKGDNSVTTINADAILGAAGAGTSRHSKGLANTEKLAEESTTLLKKVTNLITSFKNGLGDAKKTNSVTEKSTMTSSNKDEPSSNSSKNSDAGKIRIRIINVAKVTPAFGNNGHRVTTVTKDTLVNPRDASNVQEDKRRKLEEAQTPR